MPKSKRWTPAYGYVVRIQSMAKSEGVRQYCRGYQTAPYKVSRAFVRAQARVGVATNLRIEMLETG